MSRILRRLRSSTDPIVLKVVDYVWKNKNKFVKWPKQGCLFMPGAVRIKWHIYTNTQIRKLKVAGLAPDKRSNGPAIAAYLLAGGERPSRNKPGKAWAVHHIYDGHFPLSEEKQTIHAVKEGRYFTEPAGLVAIHPVADALADEVPYFAWLLRYEAYKRYGFDPDNVFKT